MTTNDNDNIWQWNYCCQGDYNYEARGQLFL